MKAPSQRRVYITVMTLLATLFCAAYGGYELRAHPDLVADLIKISALITIASVCASYVFWTLTHLAKDGVLRGGLAGFLTGTAIVPVPYFTSALKTEFFRIQSSESKGVLLSLLEAIPHSLMMGLNTFQIISKVSFVAVISSVVLGIVVAMSVPSRSDKIVTHNKPL